ncbi:hypothetical protein CPB84DRAFT_1853232 [Gymnopilus junonius]|uniref:Uncharacterized protein n=1 Tax=Gymnopilus junonius TaxID=109634 RepID=A0A9P5THG2_GYMJU|nr:hypothetical protein CPB84DRAFT_1853232 [Gymnopilus junonius]
MPASRPFLDRRRRSSHAISLFPDFVVSPAKPGVYGIQARPVTFAPNVTPALSAKLFPSSAAYTTQPAPTRNPAPAEDERRCEEVAQLLLEGKEGDDLAKAVRELDIARNRELELNFSANSVEAQASIPEPPRGYNPDGNHSAPSTITNIPTLHMPTSMHPLFGMDFSAQNAGDTFFPSNNAMLFPRRPSSVPLPNAEWLWPAIPPFASDDQAEDQQDFQNLQEFTNPFSWQVNQGFEQRMSFQFSAASFPPHQVGHGMSSAPAQVQQTLQEQQQLHSHAPIQPDAQGLFHPQPQMFGMQTTRSPLERRASQCGSFLQAIMDHARFNADMDTMHVEKDHNPLPDVDPAAAGLFADFSFGKTSSDAPAQFGGGGHHRTLSATSEAAVDPIDSSGAAGLVSGMIAPIDVPPLVHSQSQSSASTTDGSWGSVTAPQPDHGQYLTSNGVYTPPGAIDPSIQEYAPEHMYSMPGPHVMDNGMYSVDQTLNMDQHIHFQQQFEQQGACTACMAICRSRS